MSVKHSKVLIADDSNAVHQLIGNALPADYSTSIVHAFDGLECLNALDDGVDLAFIDVHMPTMGGMRSSPVPLSTAFTSAGCSLPSAKAYPPAFRP